MSRYSLKEVQEYAEKEWGFHVDRNDPKSRGWWNACWKSGYYISGNFPGLGHTHRRFTTIKAMARALGMPGAKDA